MTGTHVHSWLYTERKDQPGRMGGTGVADVLPGGGGEPTQPQQLSSHDRSSTGARACTYLVAEGRSDVVNARGGRVW